MAEDWVDAATWKLRGERSGQGAEAGIDGYGWIGEVYGEENVRVRVLLRAWREHAACESVSLTSSAWNEIDFD